MKLSPVRTKFTSKQTLDINLKDLSKIPIKQKKSNYHSLRQTTGNFKELLTGSIHTESGGAATATTAPAGPLLLDQGRKT